MNGAIVSVAWSESDGPGDGPRVLEAVLVPRRRAARDPEHTLLGIRKFGAVSGTVSRLHAPFR